MKYKALDMFPLHINPTKCELFQLALAYNVPSALVKDPFIRTTTCGDKHVLELTAYETHNKNTPYEYIDTWCIRIILRNKHIIIETIYPPTFPFDQLDEHTEQQDNIKDTAIKQLIHTFIEHNYIKKETSYVEK